MEPELEGVGKVGKGGVGNRHKGTTQRRLQVKFFGSWIIVLFFRKLCFYSWAVKAAGVQLAVSCYVLLDRAFGHSESDLYRYSLSRQWKPFEWGGDHNQQMTRREQEVCEEWRKRCICIVVCYPMRLGTVHLFLFGKPKKDNKGPP